MYGLAVEHVQNDMTVWEGENGVTCFYQSELPYDAPAAYNCVGYRVTATAINHKGYGIGVYCCFRDQKNKIDTEGEHSGLEPLIVERGICVGCATVKFINSYSRWLDGVPNSGIRKVINDQGEFSTSGEEQNRLHFVGTF